MASIRSSCWLERSLSCAHAQDCVTEHSSSVGTTIGTTGHCPASSPRPSYSAHTLGHGTWQMGARPWFSALVSSHSALPTHKPPRVTFLSVRLEDFTHVICCYVLFQSLVNSPEAKAQLPIYLAQLTEQTRKEITKINNSSANIGAIVSILDMVSSIPAEAEHLTMQVGFILSLIYTYQALWPLLSQGVMLSLKKFHTCLGSRSGKC